MLLVITKMKCSSIENYMCFINEESFDEYNSISIDYSDCCWLDRVEEYQVCDALCSLKMLIDGRHEEVLQLILKPETLLVLETPINLLHPHGPWHVYDVPECLLGIWINSSNAEKVSTILKSKLTSLVAPIAGTLQAYLTPEPLYIYYGLELDLRRGEVKTVNSVEWLYINLTKNYANCIKWFEKKCEKEYDNHCLRELEDLKHPKI